MDSDSTALTEAIRICLAQWPAMQIVRNYQQDADQQVALFAQEVESYMTRFEVDVDYLSDYLSDYLDEHFSIMIEDGSLEVVSGVLVKVQQEAERGCTDELTKLRNFSKVALPEVTKVRTEQHADPPLEGLSLEDPPAAEETHEEDQMAEPDADGFVMVTGKKPRKRG